jgi:predicted xylose isomerase-like sugar epimerase
MGTGYDGPVRSEPFNKAVNELDNDAACAAVIAALKRAVDVGLALNANR